MKKIMSIIIPIICILAVIGYVLVQRSYYPMGGEVAVIDKTATATQYHIVIREAPDSEFTLKCSKEDYDKVVVGDIIDCNRMQSVLTHKGTVHSIEFRDHTLTDERFRELADRNIGSDMSV